MVEDLYQLKDSCITEYVGNVFIVWDVPFGHSFVSLSFFGSYCCIGPVIREIDSPLDDADLMVLIVFSLGVFVVAACKVVSSRRGM
jgi:hypothetical protein